MTRKFEQPAKSGDYDTVTYTLLFESVGHFIDDFRYVKSLLCGVQDILCTSYMVFKYERYMRRASEPAGMEEREDPRRYEI